jgi:hypothetical protein
MFSVDDDHVIEAFAPDTANQTLQVATLPWTSWGYPNLLDAHTFNSSNEVVPVNSVSISQEISWRSVLRKRLQNLLCRPDRGRMICNIEMQDAPTVVRQDHKDIYHLQLNGGHCEEVNGYQLPYMVPKKCHPCLRWFRLPFRHQSRNSSLGNLKSRL